MIRVLFVCTGNTCRSPMAEAILKNKKIDHMEIKSAGIYAVDGSEASYQVKEVLSEKGILFEHSSSLLNKELVDWATYIFTMTNTHKSRIANDFPRAIEKTFTIKEFADNNKYGEIMDPFGGSVSQYRETYAELELLIEKIVDKLEK